MTGSWPRPTAQPWRNRPAKREEPEGQPTSRVSPQARPHNGGGWGQGARRAGARPVDAVRGIRSGCCSNRWSAGARAGAPVWGIDPNPIGGRNRRVQDSKSRGPPLARPSLGRATAKRGCQTPRGVFVSREREAPAVALGAALWGAALRQLSWGERLQSADDTWRASRA
jgi:hypothetical protein